MARTLIQLRTEVRERCDEPGSANSGYVKDSELNRMINNSIAELHDILISINEDYYVNEFDIVSVDNQNDYALPNDFYKMKALDYVTGGPGYALSVRPFNFNERNNYNGINNTTTVYGEGIYRYRLIGSKLTLIPRPAGALTFNLWYHPIATELTTDSSSFDGINGYEEYVVLDACIKILQKQEADASTFYQQKKDMKMRIVESASNRQDGRSLVITDVYSDNDFFTY